jgi:hypothetical protein
MGQSEWETPIIYLLPLFRFALRRICSGTYSTSNNYSERRSPLPSRAPFDLAPCALVVPYAVGEISVPVESPNQEDWIAPFRNFLYAFSWSDLILEQVPL